MLRFLLFVATWLVVIILSWLHRHQQRVEAAVTEALPHGLDACLIDRIVSVNEEKQSLIAEGCFPSYWIFFRGHFPDKAIVPGAFLGEVMAQAACLLVRKLFPNEVANQARLNNFEIKCTRPLAPGQRFRVTVIFKGKEGRRYSFEAQMRTEDNHLVAFGALTGVGLTAVK